MVNSYRIQLTGPAKNDLRKQVNVYNAVNEKLGSRFKGEIRRTMERIKQNPLLYEKKNLGLRFAPLNGFPFLLPYFLFEDEKIIVIAVFHTSRNPKIWKDRMGNL